MRSKIEDEYTDYIISLFKTAGRNPKGKGGWKEMGGVRLMDVQGKVSKEFIS
ncbi:MAG: hypothetical protein ACMUIA_09660 [bacterium]